MKIVWLIASLLLLAIHPAAAQVQRIEWGVENVDCVNRTFQIQLPTGGADTYLYSVQGNASISTTYNNATTTPPPNGYGVPTRQVLGILTNPTVNTGTPPATSAWPSTGIWSQGSAFHYFAIIMKQMGTAAQHLPIVFHPPMPALIPGGILTFAIQNAVSGPNAGLPRECPDAEFQMTIFFGPLIP